MDTSREAVRGDGVESVYLFLVLVQFIMAEVIIASKTLHTGSLFGHISNGGGLIKLTDFVGIRIIGVAENFRQIQVVVVDGGEPIRSSTWTKTKAVKKKKLKESEVVIKEEVRTEDVL